MLTLAMILDNPGEQPHATRYRDPARLRELGYSDLVIYQTTGLSGLMGPQSVTGADYRQWVGKLYENVGHEISAAHQAGMGVWLMVDAPVLAAGDVQPSMACINSRPLMLCPASDELLEACGRGLEGLLGQFERVEGIVLRLGDSDAAKVPYLVGNDLYAPHCARCSGMERADRLIRYIDFFFKLVVQRLGKRLIVRGWNVRPGGMHDNEDLCRRVVESLPEHPDLIYSFKFTHTDFWRYQKWNPASLVCGNRPVIYEMQCQREFEGKGAVPNYQPPLWRDGMKELEGAVGLAEVAEKVNLAGLWAWVRGGGWRGPYVSAETETWIDANVVAVPRLSANPRASLQDLTQAWVVERLGCSDEGVVAAIRRILHDSPRTIQESFYIGPYARQQKKPWYPAACFVQDDQIDAEAVWSIVRVLPENQLDDAVGEKHSAEQRLADGRLLLERAAVHQKMPVIDDLIASLRYAESLVRTLRYLLAGLAAYRRWLKKHEAALADVAVAALRQCQSAWVDHTQRLARSGTASPFTSDNLWDFTQQRIDEILSARS